MARKILLADDSVTAQNMGRKILADAGYEVITVNNGSAALKKIAEAKPDLIVLDVYMPGYSGLEVCQRLKEAQETSRIPVLLTVGKLEPFKPEEAKRVRAEGYIVKPFEASELLSALTKLEDKIVPRAEPSKPGRFARANAALDEGKHEGHYDKTVAIDEDSGWKDRIAFPPKKKKPVVEEEPEDSTIYNAVNKDLRTVVDRRPVHAPQTPQSEEALVDLGALAPEGLPKDVTPEEIAALAAAAAQVKGKLSESTFAAEPAPQPFVAPADARTAEIPAAEAQLAETKLAEGKLAEAKLSEAKFAEAATAEIEIKNEEKREAKAEASSLAEPPKESATPATFAAQKPEEQTEAFAAKPFDAVKESGNTVPSPSEMMAAIAGLVPEVGKSADSSSGNGSGSYAASDMRAPEAPTPHQPADEPVTMAAAAGAGALGGSVSRWTAVAATLAPDEAAISLEHEMQKAHAAFAASEVAHATPAPQVPEIQPIASEPAAAAQVSAPVETAEQVVPAPAVPDSVRAELAHDMSAVASVATEAVTAAVKEFEKIAASYLDPQPPVPAPTPVPEPAVIEAAEPVAHPAPESWQPVEAKIEEKSTHESIAPQSETAKTESAEPEKAQEAAPEPVPELKQVYPKQEEPKQEDQKHEELKHEDQKHEDQKHEEPVMAVAAPVAEEPSVTIAEKSEIAAPAAALALEHEISVSQTANQIAADPSAVGHTAPAQTALDHALPDHTVPEHAAPELASAAPVSSNTTEPAATIEPAARATKDTARKESEIAETTAAAWASWRRIRESGDAKATSAHPAKANQAAEEVGEEKTTTPQDAAAMAVAAGAEKSPEESTAGPEESGDIANIVDSVLADMRPRIVEEISRKLGKKK